MSLSGGITNAIGRGDKMGHTPGKVGETPAEYYDRRGVLGELADASVEFALEEELRQQILHGQRKRRLQNISIKLDPAQIQALRKIATTKSIPYQTLIRQWLAEGIRQEFRLTAHSPRR
jgi:predicted DNA binding CopG/RHH family protein